MLRGAANSLRSNNGRHNIHQMLFTIMAELLPLEVIHNNISIILEILSKGISANNINVQKNTLVLINTLLNTNYTVEDIPKIVDSL